jgi:hypothetical protein
MMDLIVALIKERPDFSFFGPIFPQNECKPLEKALEPCAVR